MTPGLSSLPSEEASRCGHCIAGRLLGGSFPLFRQLPSLKGGEGVHSRGCSNGVAGSHAVRVSFPCLWVSGSRIVISTSRPSVVSRRKSRSTEYSRKSPRNSRDTSG